MIEQVRNKHLLRYVLTNSFQVPETWDDAKIKTAKVWCQNRFGEERDGNIMWEATEGWMDYIDGDWNFVWNLGYCLFWFSSKGRLTQFTLTWG